MRHNTAGEEMQNCEDLLQRWQDAEGSRKLLTLPEKRLVESPDLRWARHQLAVALCNAMCVMMHRIQQQTVAHGSCPNMARPIWYRSGNPSLLFPSSIWHPQSSRQILACCMAEALEFNALDPLAASKALLCPSATL